MCRLLGLIAPSPASPAWGLSEAPKSLRVQAEADARRTQREGWGLGWYADGLHVVRSTLPIASEPDRAARAGRGTRSVISIAHIRRASNPLRQSRAALVRPENIQPFASGRYLLAHNGTLHVPREAARALGPWAERIEGTNDSEVLFWTVMMLAHKLGSLPYALAALPGHLEGVRRHLPRKRRAEPIASGLNILASDGRRLFAMALGPDRPGRDRTALASGGWPYWTLAFRPGRGRLWIASEPLDDRPGWQPLRSGEMVTAWRSGRAIRCEIRNLPLHDRR
jgi:glutamine amidotransferase